MYLAFNIQLSDIIGIVSAIIALLLGISSIQQNNKQMKASNKQAMFDRRYKIYLLLQHMDKLCNENLHLLDDGSLMASEFVASCLTNSVHFYQICNVFEKNENSDDQTKFLSLIEELKDYGVQAHLLFSENHAIYISKYFENYSNLLDEMRKCNILIDKIRNMPNEICGTNEQVTQRQQDMLQSDLVKTIEKDVKKYKDTLYDLHNDYEINKKQLDEYLSLSNIE